MLDGVIVSKSSFAKLRNVSPGRVTQWIAERKITSGSLVGEGRGAKIDVAKATAELRSKLDISQRTGNGLDTDLSLPTAQSVSSAEPQPASISAPAAAREADLPLNDPVEEQIKREKLEQLQRANRKAAEDEAARAGRFTDAAEATRRMGALVAQTLAVIEGALPEIATAFGAKFQVPQRDALHLLRAEFRKVRATGAKEFREQAASRPQMVEAELEETSNT
jgi:hypothetical protein